MKVMLRVGCSMNYVFLCSSFNVKYFQENIFQFFSVCFAVKYLVESKIFSVNQINLSKFMWNILHLKFWENILHLLNPSHPDTYHSRTLSLKLSLSYISPKKSSHSLRFLSKNPSHLQSPLPPISGSKVQGTTGQLQLPPVPLIAGKTSYFSAFLD